MKTNTKNSTKFNSAISIALSSALLTNSVTVLAANSEHLANNMITFSEQNDTNKKIDLSADEKVEYIYKTVLRSRISERIAGEDRYETAAMLSSKSYTKSDKVVIARCDNTNKANNPDAFLSASLAAALDYPLLYTKGDSIPTFTLKEIERLKAKEVIVVGGPDAIPDKTLKPLTDLGLKTTRIFGEGRWETSAKIASEIKSCKDISKAIVINSENDKNLNAAISASVALDAPILYVTNNSMSKEVQAFLNNPAIKDIYVIGDKSDAEGIGIPDSVLSGVESSKIKLINASSTSAVNDYLNELIPKRSGDSAVLINQDNLVDMPLASIYAKKNNMPLFLVDKTINNDTLSKFDKGEIKKVYTISSNVYSNVLNSIEDRIYKANYNVDTESHDKYKISKRTFESTSRIAPSRIAAELALEAYTSSESVVLSSIDQNEENLDADALLSASLASALQAPFLCLDSADTINSDTKNAIQKLGVKKVYITGGIVRISDKVENELKSMGLTVERISGDDRWITSAKIADKVDSVNKIDKVIVINHNNTKDIGAAVLASVKLNAPILYANKDTLTQETLDIINRKSVEKVYVIGNGSSNENIAISNESTSKITDQNKIVKIEGNNEEKTLVTFSSDFKQTPKKEINTDTVNTGVVINSLNKKEIIPGILYANKMNLPVILLGLSLDDYSKNTALHNNLNSLKIISNDVYAYSNSQLEDFIIKNILEANNLIKDDTIDKDNSTTPSDEDTDKIDPTTPSDEDTDKDNSTTPSDEDKDKVDSTTPSTDKDSDTNKGDYNSPGKQNPQTGDDGITKYVIGLSVSIAALIGGVVIKLKLKKSDRTSEIEDNSNN